MTYRSILKIADLSMAEIDGILARARELLGGAVASSPRAQRVIGLVFLEESLRTRVGFNVAAARLGWSSVEVIERRDGPTTSPESLRDTLRTVAGYADVLVLRAGEPLDGRLTDALPAGVINGGDRGVDAEHPSQALIDLFAIEEFAGPIGNLHVAVCGDPTMRAARSLLRLLSRRAPGQLSIIAAPGASAESMLPSTFGKPPELRTLRDVADVDVLYVAGIPHDALPLGVRSELLVDAHALDRLPPGAVVVSPLPVIDEIAVEIRVAPKVRIFEQSDLGLFVRMALLEFVVG